MRRPRERRSPSPPRRLVPEAATGLAFDYYQHEATLDRH